MNILRRDNGLNQYKQWDDGLPWSNPLHWGSGIFYDDNIPTDWVPPGNGVLMQDGYVTAGFNALNQPVQIWSPMYWGTTNWMWFGYDPLGRCVKRWVGASGNENTTTGATYFYYDGWNLIQEGPSATLVDRTYVHGGRVDEIVASRVNGSWYHHLYDAQGNCIVQSGDNGRVQVQYDYDAFGFPYSYNSSGAKVNPQTRFLFTGREWITDLRLYDYRNRMYQPELGRFLQPDPKQFAAGDYNLYRYCHNDPVNRNDPTGLKEFKLTIVLRPPLGSNIPRVLNFQGYTSAIDAGKAGGKAASQPGNRTEMHGRMASVDCAPGWYVHGPAVPGTISKDHTINESDVKGEAAGPIPLGTHEAGMYWVLAQHQDPYSWPINAKSHLSDGQVLRNAHTTGVLTNPPPMGGGQFTYYWYDAAANKEGY